MVEPAGLGYYPRSSQDDVENSVTSVLGAGVGTGEGDGDGDEVGSLNPGVDTLAP